MRDEGAIAPGADGIDEGKRLVRVGGDKGLSLAERLSERLYRLTWRTPLHAMRLKGRYPLKLIAVPDDPMMGDVARGRALMSGTLNVRGEVRAVHALDLNRPDWSPAFSHYLHGFDWLRDLSTVATRAEGAPRAEALMARWLAAHGERVDGVAWAPDLWGRRILACTAHAPLILSSTDLIYRSRVLNALARGARHLDRGADKAPPGAPRIAAWCGIVAAGLLIPGGEPRRAFGEGGLARAIAGGLFEDGGSVSRSPAMLMDTIVLLSSLRACYAARRMAMPEVASHALAKMVPALMGVMHGDRALSSWQGAGPSTPEHVAAVIAASGVRTRPLRQSREWGYQRLAAGGAVLIVDAAPPPIARLVEGGCASTLAFEFSDGEQRLVVGCGGAREAAALPLALLEGLRTTAAHSTLVVGDSNSTAIHGDGMLGRGVSAVELSRQESDAASRIEASHDGYARRWGFLHRRQLVLTGDGRELRGEDALLPAGRRFRRGGRTPFAVRFHLGVGVQASPTADGQAALLRLPGGALWQFRCRGGALGIEESLWIDGAGKPQPIAQLVVTGEAPAGGASVSWALKRAL
ncbi:heparinase II/III family protein [Sphingomonas sp. KR1UV-12]|uniref:Heparinase II/III family protein n=1 Tax=Sphingomonas aurea TaxID=3063994 RepID=A0ABT9EL97_9SPHN|nr:heparinase II/III family protein [Sphingomonas sp. KR1UV-12]MDP1027709.1 heparinase II/III family protein [Sphingomonas sp. KR1UV-12]